MLFKMPMGVHPAQQEPVAITTNKFLKGQGHSKHTRAYQAAHSVLGDTDARPTIAAAARTYKTSEYLVKVALCELRKRRQPIIKPINASTIMMPSISELSSMPEADRDQYFAGIWNLLDHYTAPAGHEDGRVLHED